MTTPNDLSRTSRTVVDTLKNRKLIYQQVQTNRFPSLANHVSEENAALILERLA